MTRSICLLLLAVIISHSQGSYLNIYPKYNSSTPDEKCGKPLILTPLIEQGKFEEAQKLAKSQISINGGEVIESYSGFFTVNPAHGSNEFFWYFPARQHRRTAPVVLWLQGGPGASSLYGLFTENGPLVFKGGKPEFRKYSWSSDYHLIYIDNPVGTGFSFTGNDDGYARNQTTVGRDLYSTLIQFFKMFPNLQQNDFYASGESYGGKYVPTICHTIHEKNKNAKLKINLKGFAIGNGFSDPIHQLSYGPYLYQLGLVDKDAKEQFDVFEKRGVELISNGKYKEASELFDTLLDGDLTAYPSLFYNLTGFTNYFNFLNQKENEDEDTYWTEFVTSCAARSTLHIGNATWNNGKTVESHMQVDMMQSVAPLVADLLSHYRGVIYNGQLDIIVAYPLTVNYLNNLNFSSAGEYKTAVRHQWIVDGEVAGYAKVAGNLTEVLVRDAGHMVPHDQPKWAFDLIHRLTSNKPFF